MILLNVSLGLVAAVSLLMLVSIGFGLVHMAVMMASQQDF